MTTRLYLRNQLYSFNAVTEPFWNVAVNASGGGGADTSFVVDPSGNIWSSRLDYAATPNVYTYAFSKLDLSAVYSFIGSVSNGFSTAPAPGAAARTDVGYDASNGKTWQVYQNGSGAVFTIRDSAGSVLGSSKLSGGSNTVGPRYVTSLNDGSSALIAVANSGNPTLVIAKVQLNTIAWQSYLASGGNFGHGRPFVDASGNIYVPVRQATTDKVSVVKLTSAGAKSSQYDTPVVLNDLNGADDAADRTVVAVDGSGNVYLMFTITGTSGYYTAYFAKFSSTGVVSWAKELTGVGGGADNIQRLYGAIDTNFNFYAVFTDGLNSGLVKVDASGNLVWQRQCLDSSLSGSYTDTWSMAARVDSNYLYLSVANGVIKLPVDGSFDSASAYWYSDNHTGWEPAFTTPTVYGLSARSDGNMASGTSVAVSLTANLLTIASFTPTTYASGSYTTTVVKGHAPFVASIPLGDESGTQGAIPAWITFPSSTGVLKSLSDTKGSSQAAIPWTTDANPGVAQYPYYGRFVSPPLAAGATISGSVTLSFARAVGNTALNMTAAAPAIYVWRPSTKALVGVLRQGNDARVGAAPTLASTEQASYGTATPASVTAQAGDQIIVDWYGRQDNTTAASYATNVYYDGGTDTNTTDNATVSDFAAYVQFTETLTFAQTQNLAAAAQAVATFTPSSGTAVASSPAAVATLTADLLQNVLLAASAAAQASVPQALILGTLQLAAAPSAAATLAPSLLQTTALAAQAAASATVAADVSTVVVVYLAAGPVAGSTAVAALANAPLLSAQLLAGSSAQAALDKSAPLSAQAASLATFSLSLVSDISLAAAGQATASLDPNLRYAVLLAAEGMDAATAAAAIDLACNMLAGASAESLVTAGLSLDVPLQVAVLGQASLTAVLQRAILADFTFHTRYMQVPAETHAGSVNEPPRVMVVEADPHAMIVASEMLAA